MLLLPRIDFPFLKHWRIASFFSFMKYIDNLRPNAFIEII